MTKYVLYTNESRTAYWASFCRVISFKKDDCSIWLQEDMATYFIINYTDYTEIVVSNEELQSFYDYIH